MKEWDQGALSFEVMLTNASAGDVYSLRTPASVYTDSSFGSSTFVPRRQMIIYQT